MSQRASEGGKSMKGKFYVSALIVLMIVMGIGGTFLFQNKVAFFAPSTVLASQPFSLTTSHDLDEGSVDENKVYVTDKDGKPVASAISISNQNQIIIEKLPPGQYKLHIKRSAFINPPLISLSQNVPFTIIEKLASIQTDEELESYFEALIQAEEVNKGRNVIRFEMLEDAAESESSLGAGSGHSETNNQVEGIEEADVTLTDGETIYTIVEQTIVLVDAKNPSNMVKQAVIRLEQNAYPHQLLLHENYLLVAFSDYREEMKDGNYEYKDFSKVAIFDITNKKDPKKVREIGQEGNIVAIRKTANMLYLVTQTAPNYWLLKEGGEVNLKPAVYDSNEEGEQLLQNDRISILPNSQDPNYTVISVLDLASGETAKVETESYLGGGAGFYMSHEAMYITAGLYNDNLAAQDGIMNRMMLRTPSETTIYRFGIQGTSVYLAGQTTIKGTVLNQFSMDEYNGYFRVATTEGNTRGEEADSTSAITIFDKQMVQQGKIRDLAKGERIYSARFMGDRAYIVTFKEMDPLFAFDLADPKNPKVLGELKIPGYSTYLHPIGENHLLGLGYDTGVEKDKDSGQSFVVQKGVKLSLFDVTDLSNPIEKDVEIIGGQGSYSQALDNHKALFRHTGKNLFGFPVSLYSHVGTQEIKYNGSGARLYEVTPEKGIELAADIVNYNSVMEYENWEETVQRMLYIDDALYLVSNTVINSYDLNSFAAISTVKLR